MIFRPSSSIAGSEVIGRCHPIEESTQPSPVDLKLELEEALLQLGILQRTGIDRLVACILVELLDNLPRLLVAAPQVARGGARFADPAVDRSSGRLRAIEDASTLGETTFVDS